MILRRGLKLTGVGVVMGVVAALVLRRFIESLLYDTASANPLIYVAGSVLLVVVALLACWLPARRAARVQPMTALRCE